VVEEQVAREADAARTAETEARGRADALEAAVDRFAELARVERLALDEGAGTQSDWLRAEAGLFQARAGLADARFDVLRARIAWAQALGLLDLDWIASLTEVTP
jgi:outer membrane protein TolC